MADIIASIQEVGAAHAVLLVIGLFAGVVNVLAGGGGLLAMPALVLFAGLGDTTANGTFRIAVLAQSIAAVWQFRRSGRSELATSARLSLPVAAGAGLGAWQAATLGDGGTRKLIIGATLLATMLLVVGDQRIAPAVTPTGRRTMDWRLAAGLVAAGWYGGLIQAGVGFTLLLVLRGLGGFDLARANVLKVELVLWYTPLAIWLFADAARMEPWAGVSVAAGMAIGAWFGVSLSVGPSAASRIRIATAVMVVVAALRLALAQVLLVVGLAALMAASTGSAAWAAEGNSVEVLASIEPGTLLPQAEAKSLAERTRDAIERCAAGRDVVLWLTVEQDLAAAGRRRPSATGGLRATSRLQVDGTAYGERVVRGRTLTALLDAAALLTCVALERLPPAPPRMAAAPRRPSTPRREAAPPRPAPDGGPGLAVEVPADATPTVSAQPVTRTADETPPAAIHWGVVGDLAAESAALPATSGRARLGVWAALPLQGWRRGNRADFAWRGSLTWEAALADTVTLASHDVVAHRWAVRVSVGAVAGPVSLEVGPSIGRVGLALDGGDGPEGMWMSGDATVLVRLLRVADVDVALQSDLGRMIAPLEVRLDSGSLLWRSTPWHGTVGLAVRWRVGVGPGRAAQTPGRRDGLTGSEANSRRGRVTAPTTSADTTSALVLARATRAPHEVR